MVAPVGAELCSGLVRSGVATALNGASGNRFAWDA